MSIISFHNISQAFGAFDVFTNLAGSVPNDGKIGMELLAMQRPEFDVPKPLSLLTGHIREPAVAARVVYDDGSTEPLDLARPIASVANGISGWFVYELTPTRRERKPVRFEALNWVGKVIGSAIPPKGA